MAGRNICTGYMPILCHFYVRGSIIYRFGYP